MPHYCQLVYICQRVHSVLQIANDWRTSQDISQSIAADWSDLLNNLDSTVGLARYGGPGGWNDADMLEVRCLPSKHHALLHNTASSLMIDQEGIQSRSGCNSQTHTMVSQQAGGVQLGVPNGSGFSDDEQRSHFALWAILKSPLFLGTDLTYGDTPGS